PTCHRRSLLNTKLLWISIWMRKSWLIELLIWNLKKLIPIFGHVLAVRRIRGSSALSAAKENLRESPNIDAISVDGNQWRRAIHQSFVQNVAINSMMEI